MPVSIRIDDTKIKKALDKLSEFPKEIPKATSAAINRTLTFTNKRVKQEVKNNYNIKAGEIKSSIKIKKATPCSLSGEIISNGKRLTLSRFSKTGKWKSGKPIKVKVKKSSVKTVNTFPSAFMTSLTGNNHIVKRKGASRYPLEVLHTLSVPQMISAAKISDKVIEESQKVLIKRVEHEVNYRLNKLSR